MASLILAVLPFTMAAAAPVSGPALDKQATEILKKVDATRPTITVETLVRPLTPYERKLSSEKYRSVKDSSSTLYQFADHVYTEWYPPTPMAEGTPLGFAEWSPIGIQSTHLHASREWRYPDYELRAGEGGCLILWARQIKKNPLIVVSEDGSGLGSLTQIHVTAKGALWSLTGKNGEGDTVQAVVDPATGYLARSIDSPIGASGNTLKFRFSDFRKLAGGAWEPAHRVSYLAFKGGHSDFREEKITSFGFKVPPSALHPLDLVQPGFAVWDTRGDQPVTWTYEELRAIGRQMPVTPESLLALTQERATAQAAGQTWTFEKGGRKRPIWTTVGIGIALLLLTVSVIGKLRTRRTDFSASGS